MLLIVCILATICIKESSHFNISPVPNYEFKETETQEHTNSLFGMSVDLNLKE